MPSIELPIRSLSILFIFGAVIAILVFPDNPHTSDLAHALFWWFLALGVVRWIESGIMKLVENNEGKVNIFVWYSISLPAFVAQVWFLINGIHYFVAVLTNL